MQAENSRLVIWVGTIDVLQQLHLIQTLVEVVLIVLQGRNEEAGGPLLAENANVFQEDCRCPPILVAKVQPQRSASTLVQNSQFLEGT